MAEKLKHEIKEDATRKLLGYSFNAIGWDYDKLTNTEKELVSKEEFEILKDEYQRTKHVGDVETDDFVLEVYECICGFHIGFDTSYLDQVEGEIETICPSCKRRIKTEKVED